ncbi:MAG: class I SAM-dependent RNA methyltransferase [Myxococcota bacterium]|nr:class I SAM-dependent RNA methyltransferase [Myxococcota bacterium]
MNPENASVEVDIESLAAGGDGLGHLEDGRVVFVPFTVPGDRVRLRVVSERSRFVRAEVESIVTAGEGRTDPVCAVFGECGGCTWQHVRYDQQLEAKTRILRDAIERIAKLAVPGEIVSWPSPSPYGYRVRTRVASARGRVGYRRARSRELCATSSCPVLFPDLEDALERLSESLGPEHAECDFEMVTDGSGGTRVVPVPGERSAVWPTTPRISIPAGSREIRLSPGVFLQGNGLLFDRLEKSVVEAASPAPAVGGLVLELYAGGGFFTLGLAHRFDQVVAVEASEAATSDLKANVDAAKLSNVDIRISTVEEVVENPGNLAPDTIVLDPPRTGLSKGSAQGLRHLDAKRIVYLSCDPATLARDLQVLTEPGYRLASLEVFDLFPQTPHVETLALLERIP